LSEPAFFASTFLYPTVFHPVIGEMGQVYRIRQKVVKRKGAKKAKKVKIFEKTRVLREESAVNSTTNQQ
jgi:capsule polysaccharide export protein KpsC/LpsZ